MGKVYILRFNHDEYERLVKLIKRDENHRIRSRETARKKSSKVDKFNTALRGPIEFEIISVLDKQNQEIQLSTTTSMPCSSSKLIPDPNLNPQMLQYLQQLIQTQSQSQNNITLDVKTDSNSFNPDTSH